ncbi:ribosomal protein S12 methylthiotransferase accessory factor [Saccharopolyspora lacisalsi]|uniref:Ribosomal protein S12 methylthiotransferase accessory factor n=1 Tax=Halosaccharopolyspora lacisalsi TaxID=1000566 RepID=A0A839E9H9_9PSEU|nr:ribosomal protein S12 methylthiotransferase accessory factor [Halosaccharopolyspora lacisalsi]
MKVLPYLDGEHTVGDIAQALSGEMSVGEVAATLRRLTAMGHLVDGRPDMPEREIAFWDSMNVDPTAAGRGCAESEVTVLGLGNVDTTPIADALERSGLSATVQTAGEDTSGSGGDLSVVVVEDYLDPKLSLLNEAFLAGRHPWLLVKPGGSLLWAGPLLRPGHTGCWECLVQRLAGNRQVERYLLGQRSDSRPLETSRFSLPRNEHTLANLVAGQVTLSLVEKDPTELEGRLLTLDPVSLETEAHVLIRQPQCAACGDPELMTKRDPRPEIGTEHVRSKNDGGYRIESPSETYQRLRKHISPLTGAVSHLKNLCAEENGITYSYSSGHNFAMVKDSMTQLKRNLRGQSGGKGRTDVQARVSALCEAIERYSGLWRGDEPVTRAAYDDLGSDAALHVNELITMSDDQYANRVTWNRDLDCPLHTVPEPFETTRVYDWSTAWSLSRERPRMVPAAYSWFGHPESQSAFFCLIDSNGNASGNSYGEAVLQGFSEIVERDSVAIWWYNRLRRPGLDLDSLHDPYVDMLREFYDGMDRSLWLLDITADLGIPAFTAVSHRRNHPVQDVVIGFGAHLDPQMAAMRALTEVNQFLPTLERRDSEGNTIYFSDDPATLKWWKETTLEQDPWLCPDERQPARRIGDFPEIVSDDMSENVRTCLRRAADNDLEVIALDQSRPEMELPVVKVMVPGMRHFWRRLGPGRLFDVPVRMGWLDKPLEPESLNPKSVFF